MKPIFEDTACPRCGDSDGITSDEAVQMVVRGGVVKGQPTVRVIWCATGHITVIDGDKVIMEGKIR